MERGRKIERQRERDERGPEGPFVSSTEGAATSKFSNCFLDWLGARWEFNLPALISGNAFEIIEILGNLRGTKVLHRHVDTAFHQGKGKE